MKGFVLLAVVALLGLLASTIMRVTELINASLQLSNEFAVQQSNFRQLERAATNLLPSDELQVALSCCIDEVGELNLRQVLLHQGCQYSDSQVRYLFAKLAFNPCLRTLDGNFRTQHFMLYLLDMRNSFKILRLRIAVLAGDDKCPIGKPVRKIRLGVQSWLLG